VSAIHLEHVTKRFPGSSQPAVDDCSLEVESGTLVVLLGPSGSGKTTLLKLVNRLYEPDAGRITLDGTDIRTIPAHQLRRRIGYVIQQVGLFPHLRVEQNIATVPDLLGWPRERTHARVDELLDLVGLPRAYRRRYPRQLSGGEQQRVGLARALAADPAVMLMDEPFGALDAITRTRLQDELRAIQQQVRKTILFVTHDVEEALRLADRLVVMRSGRIVQHDTPMGILARPADDFVRALVASDDVLRRLSLLPVSSVLASGPHGRAFDAQPASLSPRGTEAPGLSGPTVCASENLRVALSLLLKSGAERLTVTDAGGHVVGCVALEDIRRAARVGLSQGPA
jgi:osmoprotectant transport system ATP-binding protein